MWIVEIAVPGWPARGLSSRRSRSRVGHPEGAMATEGSIAGWHAQSSQRWAWSLRAKRSPRPSVNLRTCHPNSRAQPILNARNTTQSKLVNRATKEVSRREARLTRDYFLRWRIFARMRRFLRPSFRRPLPDLFVPKAISVCKVSKLNQPDVIHDSNEIYVRNARARPKRHASAVLTVSNQNVGSVSDADEVV